MEPNTGTTIVAVACKDGVVLGADSRVSMGAYVSNRASQKLAQLTDNVWLLRSGSAADTQAVADYGNSYCQKHLRVGNAELASFAAVQSGMGLGSCRWTWALSRAWDRSPASRSRSARSPYAEATSALTVALLV